MYEDIMNGKSDSLFSFFNRRYSERNKQRVLKRHVIFSTFEKPDVYNAEKENEWKQEYYIIYNSYVLEDK
jgi:hypothetical protein